MVHSKKATEGRLQRPMMSVSHFTELEIWRRSHELFLRILSAVEEFPNSKAAKIVADQVVRCAGSVGANISEGFNRSKKQFLNYLEIAKGSCYETENWLYKIRDAGFSQREKVNDLLREIIAINKMIHSLIKRLR
jgi:four helix bundle protein